MAESSTEVELLVDKTAHQALEPSPFSDVVYKELSRINGQINKMNKPTVIEKLRNLNLSIEGTTEVLKKRLKNHYKKQKLSKANLLAASKLLPFYVIVDFEATCQEINGPDYLHEIIEFPAVLVDTETQQVVDYFQSYCKPLVAPQLTEFCIQLTGISQEQVDNAEMFPEVFEKFLAWLKKHKLGTKYKFLIVTDGPWDMGRFLNGQCVISKVPYPHFAKKWINLRKAFSNFYKCKRYCLKLMLSHLGMQFEGRPHCGLDDARNIAYVLIRMMTDGATVQANERIRWKNHDRAESHVVSFTPSEKVRDIVKVRRDRSKIKDLSVFQLSDTDSGGDDSPQLTNLEEGILNLAQLNIA